MYDESQQPDSPSCSNSQIVGRLDGTVYGSRELQFDVVARELEFFVQVTAKRAVIMDSGQFEDHAWLYTLSLEK